MNKSWQLSAAFGVVFAILCGIYFLSSPPATTPREQLDDRVLSGLTSDQITQIDVVRKDGGSLSFERTKDGVGEYWRMGGPTGHAAEQALVQQMLFGLDRFVRSSGIEPGKPEAAPDLTGLADPRLTLTFVSAGRRDVLRFGKTPPTNTNAVFYQREGDPKVYLAGVDTYDAYTKPALLYRAKTLVRYAPYRIDRVTVEFRFTRREAKDKPLIAAYEKSVMQRFEEGAERGWYLIEPHRERLDDHKVAALVTELSGLPVGDYQPPGNPKEQGLDEPEAKVSLYPSGEDKPIVVHFGSLAEHGRKRWVWVPGGGEVGLLETFRYEELPVNRSRLRNSVIFPFTPELVKRLQVEVKDLGKVAVERQELKKEGEAVGTVKWVVTEPKDLRVESERLEAFVTTVVNQQIVEFLGQQDFKPVGLDPAPVRLEIETREGKKHVCGFSTGGLLRKEGVDEIFLVRPELVTLLSRLELNFLNMEMLNIPRDQLREFSFESKVNAQLQPIYYRMKLDEAANQWKFTDAGHKGVEADPELVSNLLALMNYVKAESLIARDAKTTEQHRLNEATAPATLTITYLGGLADLYISQNLSKVATRTLYYARFKNNPTVFQISPVFVESLKQVPVLKKEEKEDKK